MKNKMVVSTSMKSAKTICLSVYSSCISFISLLYGFFNFHCTCSIFIGCNIWSVFKGNRPVQLSSVQDLSLFFNFHCTCSSFIGCNIWFVFKGNRPVQFSSVQAILTDKLSRGYNYNEEKMIVSSNLSQQ